MGKRVLEGQLTRQQTTELIAPVSHFRALQTDVLTPHYIWRLRVFEQPEGVYRLFNFSRAGYRGHHLGDSDRRMALVRLESPPSAARAGPDGLGGMPHARVERASPLARLKGLLERRVRFAGPARFNRRYLVFGRDPAAVQAAIHQRLRNHLADTTGAFAMEIEGLWALIWRRGALQKNEHHAYLAEVQPMACLLSAPPS